MIGALHDPPQNAAVMLRSLLQHHRLALRALHSGQANPERGPREIPLPFQHARGQI